MALKSRDWFYKQCIAEIDNQTRFQPMAWDILKKGIGQLHGTRGHATHAIGAVQQFLSAFPAHRQAIARSPVQPYDLAHDAAMLSDWINWLQTHRGYTNARFGYKFGTLRTYLTPPLGGRPSRTGKQGGRGDDEFKTVLRLVAEFWGRK